MSYLGWPSLCLRVADLEASKRFYQESGLTLLSEIHRLLVSAGHGDADNAALMRFFDGPAGT